MNFNHIIQIIFIITIIYLLINNYENFSVLPTDNITDDDIIKEYNLDIPATRNMAQIINQAFIRKDNTYSLYLPINMVKFNKTIYINNCDITGALSTKGQAGLKFVNKSIQNIDFDIFPQYTIIAWSLKIFPKNWKLCDGKSYIKKDGEVSDFITGYHDPSDELNTPDLTDRFIMHEYDSYVEENNIKSRLEQKISRNYPFDTDGGEKEVKLTSTHIPLHHHYIPLTVQKAEYTFTEFKPNLSLSGASKSYYRVERSIRINKEHTTPNIPDKRVLDTGISCGPTVSKPNQSNGENWLNENGTYAYNSNTTSHNNMPPYCKLIYIIKL